MELSFGFHFLKVNKPIKDGAICWGFTGISDIEIGLVSFACALEERNYEMNKIRKRAWIIYFIGLPLVPVWGLWLLIREVSLCRVDDIEAKIIKRTEKRYET